MKPTKEYARNLYAQRSHAIELIKERVAFNPNPHNIAQVMTEKEQALLTKKQNSTILFPKPKWLFLPTSSFQQVVHAFPIIKLGA